MSIQSDIDKLLIYSFGDKYKILNYDLIRKGDLYRKGINLHINTGKKSNKMIRKFKNYKNLYLYSCGLFDMRLEKIQDARKSVMTNNKQ